MKEAFLSLLWAAALTAIVYFFVGGLWVVVGAFFIVLHINFFSLCMVYCDNYRDKMVDAVVGCLPAIVIGIGFIGIVAVVVAFFVGAPMYFLIAGRKEV